MMRFRSAASFACAAALAAVTAPAAHAADAATPDWPCVWRKVVELSAATIWDGPSLDKAAEIWRNDDEVRKLSEVLISRRVKLEDAEAAIDQYAKSLPEASRDQKLTELFAAVLSRTNDDRKVVIGGIEKFHKRQLARAKQIEAQGVALPPADAPPQNEPMPAGEIDKLSEPEEKYKWEVRVFQERQQLIPLACEIPQLMDERAGAIARAIRAKMKG